MFLPNKKLGINFCLNRPKNLYYIKNPLYEKPKEDISEEYLICLNKEDYIAINPCFNSNFSKIVYIGKDK